MVFDDITVMLLSPSKITTKGGNKNMKFMKFPMKIAWMIFSASLKHLYNLYSLIDT